MQNPLLKNRKTGLHDDIAHRTSHYNRVLGAKSFYGESQGKFKSNVLSSLNSKRHNSLEEQRKFNNKKLINKIIQIDKRYKNKSIGSSEEYKNPKSLKNKFVVKEQLNKIMHENKALFEKISHISSQVGSQKEWKQRNKKNKQYGNLKNKNRSIYTELDDTFFNTFNKLRFKKNTKTYIKYERNLSNRITNKSLRSKKFSTQPLYDGQVL